MTGRTVVLGWVMTKMVMSTMVTVRMTKMMMTMVVLVVAKVVLVMKLTDSRPCSVPYGRGSVFNSTVRPELQRIKAWSKFQKQKA